jgi:hypothetical protein
MIIRVAVVLVTTGCLAGCAGATPSSPPHLARKVAVLPVNNRTGEPLAVAGVGPVDRYVLRSEMITVADVLRSEARMELEKGGFEVVPSHAVDATLKGRIPADFASAGEMAAQLGIPSLYLEIRRWEAEAPMHPKHVIVAFGASLFDPGNRQALWHVERKPFPVRTAGVITMEAAYVAAARKVVEEMLGTLHPDSSTTR